MVGGGVLGGETFFLVKLGSETHTLFSTITNIVQHLGTSTGTTSDCVCVYITEEKKNTGNN